MVVECGTYCLELEVNVGKIRERIMHVRAAP